jgi:hypothetical protein
MFKSAFSLVWIGVLSLALCGTVEAETKKSTCPTFFERLEASAYYYNEFDGRNIYLSQDKLWIAKSMFAPVQVDLTKTFTPKRFAMLKSGGFYFWRLQRLLDKENADWTNAGQNISIYVDGIGKLDFQFEKNTDLDFTLDASSENPAYLKQAMEDAKTYFTPPALFPVGSSLTYKGKLPITRDQDPLLNAQQFIAYLTHPIHNSRKEIFEFFRGKLTHYFHNMNELGDLVFFGVIKKSGNFSYSSNQTFNGISVFLRHDGGVTITVGREAYNGADPKALLGELKRLKFQVIENEAMAVYSLGRGEDFRAEVSFPSSMSSEAIYRVISTVFGNAIQK